MAKRSEARQDILYLELSRLLEKLPHFIGLSHVVDDAILQDKIKSKLMPTLNFSSVFV